MILGDLGGEGMALGSEPGSNEVLLGIVVVIDTIEEPLVPLEEGFDLIERWLRGEELRLEVNFGKSFLPVEHGMLYRKKERKLDLPGNSSVKGLLLQETVRLLELPTIKGD